MFVKTLVILSFGLFVSGMAQITSAETAEKHGGHMKHHDMMSSGTDERISLGLSAEMKQHQLSNMRSHLEAVQEITGLIAQEDFESASAIAHSRLGLTDEMKKMCGMFGNDDFTALGLAFHESGDALGVALLTGDSKKSLLALQDTLIHCTQCHATFRQ